MPEKLTSERPIEAEEPPETLRSRPLKSVSVLPLPRLTRFPAMLRTLPPATLTRWPLRTLRELPLRLIMARASLGRDTLAWRTRSTTWPEVVTAVPPFRVRGGAVASRWTESVLHDLRRI